MPTFRTGKFASTYSRITAYAFRPVRRIMPKLLSSRFPRTRICLVSCRTCTGRGKAFRYEVVYPDGGNAVLASIPRYDFNWQTTYQFAKPLEMPKGTIVRSIAHWDNSRNNLANPDPSREVTFGLQTSEEMMLGILTYTSDTPVVAQLPELTSDPRFTALFEQLDANQSGYIEREEIPLPMREAMASEGIELGTGLSALGVEALMSAGFRRA